MVDEIFSVRCHVTSDAATTDACHFTLKYTTVSCVNHTTQPSWLALWLSASGPAVSDSILLGLTQQEPLEPALHLQEELVLLLSTHCRP